MKLSGSLLEGQPWINTKFCKDQIKMPHYKTWGLKTANSACDSDTGMVSGLKFNFFFIKFPNAKFILSFKNKKK